MSAQGTYRCYCVKRQTILLVNGEPLGRERVNAGPKAISTELGIRGTRNAFLDDRLKLIQWKMI